MGAWLKTFYKNKLNRHVTLTAKSEFVPHGDMISRSFNPTYFHHNKQISNVHLGYHVGFKLESSWT
jgi:hypothetical protein